MTGISARATESVDHLRDTSYDSGLRGLENLLPINFPAWMDSAKAILGRKNGMTSDQKRIAGLNYILLSMNLPITRCSGEERKSDGMGAFHPMAWYHEFDGGRAFYTALGHMPSDYIDPAFLNHVYAGIYYTAKGKKVSRDQVRIVMAKSYQAIINPMIKSFKNK